MKISFAPLLLLLLAVGLPATAAVESEQSSSFLRAKGASSTTAGDATTSNGLPEGVHGGRKLSTSSSYEYTLPYTGTFTAQTDVPLSSSNLYNFYGIGDAAGAAIKSVIEASDPYSNNITTTLEYEDVPCFLGGDSTSSGNLTMTASGISGFTDVDTGFEMLISSVYKNGRDLKWKSGYDAKIVIGSNTEVMLVTKLGETTLTASMWGANLTICGSDYADTGDDGTITLHGVQVFIKARIGMNNNLQNGNLNLWKFTLQTVSVSFDEATTDIGVENDEINNGVRAFAGSNNFTAFLNGVGAVEVQNAIKEGITDIINSGIPVTIGDYYLYSDQASYGWFAQTSS